MEIERKFLLTKEVYDELSKKGFNKKYINASYIFFGDTPELRISEHIYLQEQKDNKYKVTIKTPGDLSRVEIEKDISVDEYRELLKYTDGTDPIRKTRFLYALDGINTLEVNNVDNGNLYYAEIEFNSTKEARDFVIPEILKDCKEVTNDSSYKMKNYWKKYYDAKVKNSEHRKYIIELPIVCEDKNMSISDFKNLIKNSRPYKDLNGRKINTHYVEFGRRYKQFLYSSTCGNAAGTILDINLDKMLMTIDCTFSRFIFRDNILRNKDGLSIIPNVVDLNLSIPSFDIDIQLSHKVYNSNLTEKPIIQIEKDSFIYEDKKEEAIPNKKIVTLPFKYNIHNKEKWGNYGKDDLVKLIKNSTPFKIFNERNILNIGLFIEFYNYSEESINKISIDPRNIAGQIINIDLDNLEIDVELYADKDIVKPIVDNPELFCIVGDYLGASVSTETEENVIEISSLIKLHIAEIPKSKKDVVKIPFAYNISNKKDWAECDKNMLLHDYFKDIKRPLREPIGIDIFDTSISNNNSHIDIGYIVDIDFDNQILSVELKDTKFNDIMKKHINNFVSTAIYSAELNSISDLYEMLKINKINISILPTNDISFIFKFKSVLEEKDYYTLLNNILLSLTSPCKNLLISTPYLSKTNLIDKSKICDYNSLSRILDFDGKTLIELVDIKYNGLLSVTLPELYYKEVKDMVNAIEFNNDQETCWFCRKRDNDLNMEFSTEFDTYFHKSCMEERLKLGDPEAIIIDKEFKK